MFRTDISIQGWERFSWVIHIFDTRGVLSGSIWISGEALSQAEALQQVALKLKEIEKSIYAGMEKAMKDAAVRKAAEKDSAVALQEDSAVAFCKNALQDLPPAA